VYDTKNMSPESSSQSFKVCPTCGTRMADNAPRCLVCGRNFTTAGEEESKSHKPVQGPKMPEVTLSLPVAMGLILVLLVIGAGVVYGVLRQTERIVEPTATVTQTVTPTITLTVTATVTSSPEPTWTPLPTLEYTVRLGDSCLGIAGVYKISVKSIADLNNLPSDCGILRENQKLFIPQPTLTASPLPSPTLNDADKTDVACEKVKYVVQSGDTLSNIAKYYNVTMDTIKSYNSLTRETLLEGETIIIPLCERKPTAGPTSTATPPPPYPAPNLLLPVDGAAFMTLSDTITLQWASVGTLRENESYAVTIEDVTGGEKHKLVEYVTDTKYILPDTFRPTDNIVHIFRWWIIPVRQVGTTKDGEPMWENAGTTSMQRVFSWWGSGLASPTP
jgi:LysM repeat protein